MSDFLNAWAKLILYTVVLTVALPFVVLAIIFDLIWVEMDCNISVGVREDERPHD